MLGNFPANSNSIEGATNEERTSGRVAVTMGQAMPCLKARQDGGDGHVGTVVEVRQSSSRSPEKTVVVQWDNGLRSNYRVGYREAYDLLVFDGAPAGVKHFNKRCGGCGRRDIKGIRWQCTQCSDYDLCTRCYMDNVHDIQHKFRRFLTSKSTGVLIPKPRSKSRRSQASGIFPGAKVIRGCDWIWDNQDGGPGGVGAVSEIRAWQNDSGNSVACVSFRRGGPNIYRVGHRGKVDLKYVTPAKGPMYYKDHLPVLGKDHSVPCPFAVGDLVKVSLDVDVLKQLQKGHGGWNPKMADLIDLVGVVHRITQAGDVRVQYPAPALPPQENGNSTTSPSSATDNNRWTFNPEALTRVPKEHGFAIGDQVRVIEDCAKVMVLQTTAHGNWHERMKECLGQSGCVIDLYADGDVRIEFSSPTRQWTFNPTCLVADPDAPAGPSLAHDLVSKAALGDLQGVKQIISERPQMVAAKSRQVQGAAALHVAAYRGRKEIVRFLLSKGADISVTDDVGDGALHFAMASKSNDADKNDCVRLLLENSTKADVNLVNAKRQSPLHAAVIQDNIAWAKKILQLGCDVNKQDNEGDTAAHCCVTNHDNGDMMRILLRHPEFDPSVTNLNEFNVLHRAAVKGRLLATEAILEVFPPLAQSAKNDGLTALHLAVLNKHERLSEILVDGFPVLIDKQDKSGQTPLYVASSEGIPSIVRLLTAAGAVIGIPASDGKTCLHAALEKFNSNWLPDEDEDLSMTSSGDYDTMELPSNSEWLEIKDLLRRSGFVSENAVYLGIACHLVRAALDQCPPDDDAFLQSALELVRDEKARAILREVRKNKCMTILASDFSNIVNVREDAPPRKLLSSPTSRWPPRSHDSTTHCHVTNNFVKSFDHDMLSNVEERQECMTCSDELASVVFRPCGHKLVCAECCVRMKKCIKCHISISEKVDEDGQDVSIPSIEQQGQVLELERKVRELQESNQCIICMENQRDTALKCGHRFCHKCAQTLRKHCPICRKPITGTIHLYD